MSAGGRAGPALSQFGHSFSLKLSLLAIVLLTVPIALYWQFRRYEHEQAVVLRNALEQTSRLITAILRPHLANFSSEGPQQLRNALTSAAVAGISVKILLRPGTDSGEHFFYVMSSPPVSFAYLRQEKQALMESGIFRNLMPTCNRSSDLSVRFINPAGRPELLTSMIPIHTGNNCWVVITSESAGSISQAAHWSSGQTQSTIRAMMAIYIFSTVLVAWLFVHLWRNVSRFRRAARHIRLRRGAVSFGQANTIPELRGVAEDFDSLVIALVESQMFIRRAAEENAHALKAPLAVIAQSIEPLKRTVADRDQSAQRSIQLIERSVARLDGLLSSAREMEAAVADVIYPECSLIELSKVLVRLLEGYETSLLPQKKRLLAMIAPNVRAYANEDILEVVIENLLENAASFTAGGGEIEVALYADREFAHIRIADRGPGVDPRYLGRIFDRYFSYRVPSADGDEPLQTAGYHQGLGLWIVKRNVVGLGGSVMARNRDGGGFEITVNLRARL
jgi:two-component system, OmpR family, sensor histidine kinase ChvG